MRKIKALFFKESGKLYDTLTVEVPEELHVFEICAGFKDLSLCQEYKFLPYVMINSADENDPIMYPCLIIRK